MRFEGCAMVAVTGDLDTWAPESLRVGPFFPSQMGGHDYLQLGRWRHEGNELAGFEIVGPDVEEFLAQWRRLILWHWPKQEFIGRMHARGVEVALACAYESVNQLPPWDRIQDELWNLSSKYLLYSDKPNQNGDLRVDYYEAYPVSNKNHSWAVDLERNGIVLAEKYVKLLEQLMVTHYPIHLPNRLFFDVLIDRRYWGTASNAPLLNLWDYLTAWSRLIVLCNGRVLPVVGHNTSLGQHVSTLFGRMDEFAGRKSWEMLSADLIAGMNYGFEMGLGFARNSRWTVRPDDWQQLRAMLDSVTGPRNELMFAVTGRTGSSFPLFWPGAEYVVKRDV